MDPALAAMKKEFLAEAEAAFERMMVAEPEQMLTFTQIEARAVELSRQFGTGLIARRLQVRQEEGCVCCPRCQAPGELCATAAEARSLESLSGPIEFKRSKYRCKRCRIRFFPRRRAFGSGRGRV